MTKKEKEKSRVTSLLREVQDSESYWHDVYDRIKKNKFLVRYGTTPEKYDAYKRKHIVNITGRYITQATSALYARNPKAVAKRKQRIDYRIYSGKFNDLMKARMEVQAVLDQNKMLPPEQQIDPSVAVGEAVALLKEYEKVETYKRVVEKIGRALELLFNYYTDSSIPNFKRQMKRMVTNTLQSKVSFLKMGFEREEDEYYEDTENRIDDLEQRVDHLEALKKKLTEGEYEDKAALEQEITETEKGLEGTIQNVVKEAIIFMFPKTENVIVDKNCRSLHGFEGANIIAEKHFMTRCDAEEKYTRVDLSSASVYREEGFSKQANRKEMGNKPDDLLCIFEVYDRRTGLCYHLCDGIDEYLCEPDEPSIKVKRFFPYYPLLFNSNCEDDEIYPTCDVEIIEPMQLEYNRLRSDYQDVRRGKRPKWALKKGFLSDSDKAKLQTNITNAVLELEGLRPEDDIRSALVEVPSADINPQVYETSTIYNDIEIATGFSESAMGSLSGATATEVESTEMAKNTGLASKKDDLDEFLTEFAKDFSEVALNELSEETVTSIAGSGAIWPEEMVRDMSKDLFLEIKAGSSGKPNKQQEIRTIERLMPFLLQMPNIDPYFMAETLLTRYDESIELEEALMQNTPSIIAQNSNAQPGNANPSSDPNMQGQQGRQNAPKGQEGTPPPAPNQAGMVK